MADLFLGAFALMLIIEGLLPFLSPPTWREMFRKATTMSDGQIRFVGMVSLLAGVMMMSLFGP